MLVRRSARSSRRVPFALAAISLGLSVIAIAAPGCSSKETTPLTPCATAADGLTCAPGTCAAPGAATKGPVDSHCGTKIQPTSQAACAWDGGGVDPGASAATTSGAGGMGGAGGAATTGSGGPGGAGGADNSVYGPTQYGNESDDDDCKYHVSWTASPLCENGGVTFTVKATHKTDGTPLTGAEPFAEVYLNATHPSPNGPCACETSATTESTPGTYTIGPVFFDAPGNWTVRFHFYEQCTDFSDASQHGHAAYYITVP